MESKHYLVNLLRPPSCLNRDLGKYENSNVQCLWPGCGKNIRYKSRISHIVVMMSPIQRFKSILIIDSKRNGH